jgi:hypothetical protein
MTRWALSRDVLINSFDSQEGSITQLGILLEELRDHCKKHNKLRQTHSKGRIECNPNCDHNSPNETKAKLQSCNDDIKQTKAITLEQAILDIGYGYLYSSVDPTQGRSAQPQSIELQGSATPELEGIYKQSKRPAPLDRHQLLIHRY